MAHEVHAAVAAVAAREAVWHTPLRYMKYEHMHVSSRRRVLGHWCCCLLGFPAWQACSNSIAVPHMHGLEEGARHTDAEASAASMSKASSSTYTVVHNTEPAASGQSPDTDAQHTLVSGTRLPASLLAAAAISMTCHHGRKSIAAAQVVVSFYVCQAARTVLGPPSRLEQLRLCTSTCLHWRWTLICYCYRSIAALLLTITTVSLHMCCCC